MLEIRNIVKDYETGSETVHALKGVSIAFRESETGKYPGSVGLRQDYAAEHHRRS